MNLASDADKKAPDRLKTVRRGLFILCVISSRGVSAWAAPGATTENFLKIGLSPRAVALGEAYVGLADDVHAIAYNPAGLALLPRQEATFMDNEYVQGIRQNYMAYAYPGKTWGSVGFSANLLTISAINAFDANDVPIGAVSAQDAALSAAYAKEFGRFALGVNGKYLSSRLDTSHARATAWDVGALWSPHRQLRLGAALQNIGPNVKFASEAFPLPLLGRLGASYLFPLTIETMHLLMTVEGVYPRDRSPYPSAGVEFAPVNFAAIRVGYQGNQDAGMGLTLGAGFKVIDKSFSWFSYSQYPDWFPEIDVDYAFVSLGDLGNVHRFGLLVRFGQSKESDEETSMSRKGLRGPVYYGVK